MTDLAWYSVAIYRPDDPTGRIRVATAQGLSIALQVREGEAFKLLEEQIDASAWRMIEGVLTPIEPEPST